MFYRVILDAEAAKAVRQRDNATLDLFANVPMLPKGARPATPMPAAPQTAQPSLFTGTSPAAAPRAPAPKVTPSAATVARQEHERRALEHLDAAAGAATPEAKEAHRKAAHANHEAAQHWAAADGPAADEFSAQDARDHTRRANLVSGRAAEAERAPAAAPTPAPSPPGTAERAAHEEAAAGHRASIETTTGEAQEAHRRAERSNRAAAATWAQAGSPGFDAAAAQTHSEYARHRSDDARSAETAQAAQPAPAAAPERHGPPPQRVRITMPAGVDPSHMGHLIPIKKRDKTGKLTTRWIKPDTEQAVRGKDGWQETEQKPEPHDPLAGLSPEERERAEKERAAQAAKAKEEKAAREKMAAEDRQRRIDAAAKEHAKKEAELRARQERREGWEYPFEAPPDALLPAELKPGQYSTWVRKTGSDEWRMGNAQLGYGDLMSLEQSGRFGEAARERWEELFDEHRAQGQDLVYVPLGKLPMSGGAQPMEGTAEPGTYEDLPPDFLGLRMDAFKVRTTQGRFGPEHSPLVDADPFLKDIGFWEALGPEGQQGEWVRTFFMSQVGRGKTYGQLSDRVREIYAGIFRNFASWWTDLNDDEREQFNRDYVDAARQPQRGGLDKDARHEDESFAMPPGMEPFTALGFKPHAYQNKAANFAIKHAPRAVFAMEMGLGKTLTAQMVYMDLRAKGEVDRMLITAPVSAADSWRDHFEEFTQGLRVKYLAGASIAARRKAYDAFEKGELDVIVMSPDTLAMKLKKTTNPEDLDALPVGHEVMGMDHHGKTMVHRGSFWKRADGTWGSSGGKGGSSSGKPIDSKELADSYHEIHYDDPDGDPARIAQIMAQHGSKILRVADEVQKFKSPTAARSRGFWKAITDHDGRVIGMTGTPKPNGAADFYHVVDHIAPGSLGQDIREFGRRYCYTDERGELTGFRPEELTRLHADNAHVMFARSTGDPDAKINLPARIDLAPSIPMDETQVELQKHLILYMEIRAAADRERKAMEHDKFIGDANIRRMDEAKDGKFGPLERAAAKAAPYDGQGVLLRWSQLAIDPTALDPEFAVDFPDYESPKLQAVAEATIEHLTQNPETGAVLFCEFHSGMHAARRALLKRGIEADKIGFYHGGTSPKERRRLKEALNSGDIKVLIGQTASLETGANLQKRANFVAHLNTPWAPDRLSQSTARVHRQGQPRKVTVFRPVGSEVEALIERTVTRKIQESRQATGKKMEAEAAIAKSMSKGERTGTDAASLAAVLGINPELLAKDQGEKLKMPEPKAMDRMSKEAWEDSILRNDILPRYRERNGEDAADALHTAFKAARKKHPSKDVYELVKLASNGELDLGGRAE